MRYALYFTPAPDDPLTRAARSWLGRDAFTGETVGLNTPAGLTGEAFSEAISAPRRYGFHATLVAPFYLRDGLNESELVSSTDAFAQTIAPFTIPALVIGKMGNFFALTPVETAGVSTLASAAVDHFERLRMPPTDAELARRKPELLSERQRRYLHRYGYPFVKEEFRFHMTLSGPVEAGVAAPIEKALEDRFGALLARPVEVSAVALFVEPEPGADFTVRSLHPFDPAKPGKHA